MIRNALAVVAALLLLLSGVPDVEAARYGGGKGYSSSRGKTLQTNRQSGKAREAKTIAALKNEHPKAKIQNESTLRTADGKIAKDPLTGKGRRIDHAVIEDGKVVKTVETTSQKADKISQSAKESRILNSGGKYVRERDSKELLEVPTLSEIIRHP